MADDQRETRISDPSPDAPRIDLSRPDVKLLWCRRLVCTEVELREAVEAVGTSATKVRAYLDALRWNAKRRGPMITPPWTA
jgi:hypothetical protein